jgi:S1-C subfamily serine protease
MSGLPLLRIGVFCCWLATFTTGWLVAPAPAQTVGDNVKKNVVYIQVTGEDPDGNPIPPREGTGFFIDDHGQILTTYHLLEPFKKAKAKEETIKFRFSIGHKNKDSPPEEANHVSSLPHLDLMLLQMRLKAERPPSGLLVGTKADVESDQPLHTYGFPESLEDIKYSLKYLSGKQNVGGSTWLLDGTVEGGQSGSPVYNSKGWWWE